MTINVIEYSMVEAVEVRSDYQTAENDFYAEWAQDIQAEEVGGKDGL